MTGSNQAFRDQFKRKYRKYRATRILTNSLSSAEREQLDRLLADIDTFPTPHLRKSAKKFGPIAEKTFRLFGVVGTLEQLEDPLAQRQPNDHRTLLFMSKYYLTTLFLHYEKVLPVFPRLPPHARIGVDVDGVLDSAGRTETFLLEASLFEDLAALWNVAVVAQAKATELEAKAREKKEASALVRATAKACFNLLEGYLNGLAFDILLTKEVTAKEAVKLKEWDPERKRSVYLSLRDKLIQYPKIATGSQYPSLQENNSEPMRLVLDLEKRVRHALIHPTPLVSPERLEEFREGVFFALELDEIGALCDAVVDLISQVSETVGKEFGDVTLWLKPRGLDGFFPEETFD